jgi:hypothetical protein
VTTTTERESLWARATMPYALSGLASHIIDCQLPNPEQIDAAPGRIDVWILDKDVAAWKANADVLTDAHHALVPAGPTRIHAAEVRLHGSCALVRLRWVGFVDHEPCTGDDGTCSSVICRCRVDSPCDGTVEAICGHGTAVCADHAGQCDACRAERAPHQVGFGWVR